MYWRETDGAGWDHIHMQSLLYSDVVGLYGAVTLKRQL